MAVDFKHTFNDNGKAQPALIVSEEDENNVVVAYISQDDGTWHLAKASRGDEPGQFKNKT